MLGGNGISDEYHIIRYRVCLKKPSQVDFNFYTTVISCWETNGFISNIRNRVECVHVGKPQILFFLMAWPLGCGWGVCKGPAIKQNKTFVLLFFIICGPGKRKIFYFR